MSDFKEEIYHDVEFVNNRLHAPHRWDHMATRRDSEETGNFVECTVEDLMAAWTVRFQVSKETATEIHKKAEAHFNDRKKHSKKMGKFSVVRGYKEDNENDRFIFAAKQNCKSAKTGKLIKQPAVVGPDLKPLADPKWSSGTKGIIKFNMCPTSSPKDNDWGITLYVKAVVITEPKYFNNELEGMGSPTSYDSLNEFLSDGEQKQQSGENVEDLEDEIPF